MSKAARVKTIILSSADCPQAMACAVLSLHCPKKPLFPNLRRLHWKENHRDDGQVFSFATLFLGPLLQDLKVEIEAGIVGIERIISLLNTVQHMHTPIRSLSVINNNVEDDPHRFTMALSDLVCSLDLEKWPCITEISHRAILHLANSPALRVAYLMVKSDMVWEDLFGSGTAAVFPVVEFLSLTGSDISLGSILGILPHIESRRLNALAVTILNHGPTPEEFFEFCSRLTRLPDPLRIWLLHFEQKTQGPFTAHDHSVPLQSEFAINSKVLEPLCALTSLTDLYIINYHLDVDDQLISNLVKHLPLLTSLYLLPGFYDNREPKATLMSLARISSGLPNLRDFGFPFRPVTLQSTALPPVYNQVCRKIEVGYSPLAPQEVNSTALFISAYFGNSNLRLVIKRKTRGTVANAYERGEHWAEWKKCQDMLPLLHTARREERDRYSAVSSTTLSRASPSRG